MSRFTVLSQAAVEGFLTGSAPNLFFVAALAATGLATPGVAIAAPTIADASFESPNVGGGYAYDPSASGVTFTGPSGVAAAGSTFGPGASDGNQYAFMQSTATPGGVSISLAVSDLLAGATYNFTFDTATRPGFDATAFSVSFDGINLGSFTPTAETFATFTTANFTAAGTGGTLTFTGAPTINGDNDARIDNVGIAIAAPGAVPEPATWAMMLVGFGGVGYSVRRRAKDKLLAAG